MEKALTALLASVAGGRRYWVRKPQREPARPYVVMQRISGVHDYHLQGPSGYVASRVQIDCYGDTYDSAASTAGAVRGVLSGHRGGVFQGIFLDGERDLPAADAGEVTNLFRVSLDFMIHHSE